MRRGLRRPPTGDRKRKLDRGRDHPLDVTVTRSLMGSSVEAALLPNAFNIASKKSNARPVEP